MITIGNTVSLSFSLFLTHTYTWRQRFLSYSYLISWKGVRAICLFLKQRYLGIEESPLVLLWKRNCRKDSSLWRNRQRVDKLSSPECAHFICLTHKESKYTRNKRYRRSLVCRFPVPSSSRYYRSCTHVKWLFPFSSQLLSLSKVPLDHGKTTKSASHQQDLVADGLRSWIQGQLTKPIINLTYALHANSILDVLRLGWRHHRIGCIV